MKTLIAITIICAVVSAFNLRAEDAPSASTPYDPAPDHLWNRLNKALFIRTDADGTQFGFNEPDILYWVGTKHLLDQPSHQQALAILDEFIHSHGERLIRDPLKRTLLQRDLWELFDWVGWPGPNSPFPQERKELESRLAVLIRRLALTTNEIASLPDNYAQGARDNLPDLPQGLFETNGDWVNLTQGPYGEEIAPAHDHYFGACSPFLVMMHAPGARETTTNYLNQLNSVDRVWTYRRNSFDGADSREFLDFSPNLPQFPAKTEFALVRRMCVIDQSGSIVPTPIIESIQMRRYLAIADPTSLIISNRVIIKPPEEFFEFRMDRRQGTRLRELPKDETDFNFFMTKGFDQIEGTRRVQRPTRSRSVLEDCATCHSGAGIYSVNSYMRLFSSRYLYPPKPISGPVSDTIRAAIGWKEGRFSWGLLQGLWNQAN
ncbi:MAG TPA: hypothetical protein VMF08_18735 [Candidatus Sulfotelmatobacter sp.]|nr:hypothetical protein [Candidatus Sulfotelmatobacter sp.]